MSNRKLLIADDSVTIQKVIKLTFSEEGYEVFTAPDGEAAMGLLRAERPDIVLADVNMPGPDGYEICRAIRSDINAHSTPVVLLAGSFEPFDEQMASAVGASASVTKPFQSIRQLVHQVNELVESSSPVEQQAPEPAGFEFPTANGVTSDIESLYHESISDSTATAETVEFEFSDQGLDDEMIETHFAGEPAERIESEPFQEIQTISPAYGSSFETLSPEPEQSGIPTVTFDGPSFSEEVATAFDSAPTNYPAAADEPVAEARPDSEPLVPVSDGFEFEPVVSTEREAEPFRNEPAQEATEDFLGQETIAFDIGAAYPEAEQRAWDDVDLLEIPPFGDEGEVKVVTETEVRTEGRNERAVAVSEEVIEVIVRRVLEELERRR